MLVRAGGVEGLKQQIGVAAAVAEKLSVALSVSVRSIRFGTALRCPELTVLRCPELRALRCPELRVLRCPELMALR